jgi:very-short-patch-repair endonuclease
MRGANLTDNFRKTFGRETVPPPLRNVRDLMYEGRYWIRAYRGFDPGIRPAGDEKPTHGPVKVIFSKDPNPVVYPPTFLGMKAGEMRQIRKTPAEDRLYKALRCFADKGYRFECSIPLLDKFIVDLYCEPAKLIVEVDGLYHRRKKQRDRDKWRTALLLESGYHMLRFTNAQVFRDLDGVLRKIGEQIGVPYETTAQTA